MVSLKTMIYDKLSIVIPLKDNQDNKDQNDTSTTRPTFTCIILHYCHYIVEYHEIVSHNKNTFMFYTRVATSRHFVKTKSKRSICNLCFHEMTVVLKVKTEE